MTGNIYALIRVSTEEQNEERQVIAMTRLGIPKENIIIEKESGKSTVRTKYKNLIRKLRSGDTLYIENLDRLSRDYDGIIREWNTLTKLKGVTVKILDTPFLDIFILPDDLSGLIMALVCSNFESLPFLLTSYLLSASAFIPARKKQKAL